VTVAAVLLAAGLWLSDSLNLTSDSGPGLGTSDTRDIQWTSYDEQTGNYVRAVAVDNQGGLWIATLSGVSHFNGREWTTYTPPDDTVYEIAVDEQGRVWTATYDGPWVFDDRNWRRPHVGDVEIGAADSVEVGGKGVVAIASHTTMAVFDGQQWRVKRPGETLPHHGDTVAVADDGTVWIGTRPGVWRFDGTRWTRFGTGEKFSGNVATSVAVAPNGNLWVGTGHRKPEQGDVEGRGLSMFDGETWRTYTQRDGLNSNVVNAVAVADNGTVWAGTEGGLSRFDGEQWTTYTAEDGLAGNGVTSIAIDENDTVWTGTHDGVSQLHLP
jgi:ligand-binding sensor domain-containing protein